MKQRLRYLYRDNNRTYYEILFSAMTFSELLNQSIYVEKLHEYDHRMLLSYKAQREAIEEMEAKLEEEKAQLDDQLTFSGFFFMINIIQFFLNVFFCRLYYIVGFLSD